MMILQYLIFLVPVGLSLVFTPLVISYATKVGAIDQPNERKVHHHAVPRLGGVAIYLSFFLSLILAMFVNPNINTLAGMSPHNGVLLVGSLTLVLFLGIWDDIKPLTPGRKFLGQVVAATIVYLAGFRITTVTHPVGSELLDLGLLAYPLTIIWIVGITNAFNLIDGLDGLAGGVAVIASATIFSIAYMKQDTTTAMMAALLAGSLLGFLRYNFRNAKIFLGDSGSLFVGFTLAIISMQGSTKGSTAFSILIPMLALGLPIMDTMLSMVRRLIKSVLPSTAKSSNGKSRITAMFHPDRGHIHHQLVARGFSHRKVVLLLYCVSCLFGLGAFAVTFTNNVGASLIIIAIAIATFIGMRQLRYKEMAVLRNGLFLPMYEWPLFHSSVFLSFLDLGIILLSFFVSNKLAFRGNSPLTPGAEFLTGLALCAGVQMLVFNGAGIYRHAIRQFGLGDILKITKGVSAATAATVPALLLLPKGAAMVDIPFLLLDFFILLSLILMVRGSFGILNFLSRKEGKENCTKILIYGADTSGLMLLQRLIHDDTFSYCPVGFLDDDPLLEGKRLNGYPIFGGHWKLSRLIQTKAVKEIVISSEPVNPIVMGRLVDLCREHNLVLRRSRVHIEEYQPPVQPAVQHGRPKTELKLSPG